MIILTVRTDQPEAELGLYDDTTQLAYDVWTAHRELGATIHLHIDALLGRIGMELSDIQGIVCYPGPGSFTGLRIGISVANALAYALSVPIVACPDPRWLETGIGALMHAQNDRVVQASYGAAATVTAARK